VNGDIIYNMAQVEMAERHERAARRQLVREARRASRASRASRARARAAVSVPAIPDYAHELLGRAASAVPAPREAPTGGHARSGR
jgi:hypothetical protein